jgi:hypothetical protein
LTKVKSSLQLQHISWSSFQEGAEPATETVAATGFSAVLRAATLMAERRKLTQESDSFEVPPSNSNPRPFLTTRVNSVPEVQMEETSSKATEPAGIKLFRGIATLVIEVRWQKKKRKQNNKNTQRSEKNDRQTHSHFYLLRKTHGFGIFETIGGNTTRVNTAFANCKDDPFSAAIFLSSARNKERGGQIQN